MAGRGRGLARRAMEDRAASSTSRPEGPLHRTEAFVGAHGPGRIKRGLGHAAPAIDEALRRRSRVPGDRILLSPLARAGSPRKDQRLGRRIPSDARRGRHRRARATVAPPLSARGAPVQPRPTFTGLGEHPACSKRLHRHRHVTPDSTSLPRLPFAWPAGRSDPVHRRQVDVFPETGIVLARAASLAIQRPETPSASDRARSPRPTPGRSSRPAGTRSRCGESRSMSRSQGPVRHPPPDCHGGGAHVEGGHTRPSSRRRVSIFPFGRVRFLTLPFSPAKGLCSDLPPDDDRPNQPFDSAG